MSDITKLTEKIIQEAQKKEYQIVQTGQEEVSNQIAIQKQQLVQQFDERLQQFEKQAQNDLKLRVSDANAKARNDVLLTRQAVLDEFFSEALRQLQEISDEEFEQFLLSNIDKTQVEGRAEIILGAASQKFATEATVKHWQETVAPKVTLEICEETIPNQSGFILKQDYLEYNFLFESLLLSTEEELSADLVEWLFEEE